jgi:transcriptional regulator with XRE-family HTH domain
LSSERSPLAVRLGRVIRATRLELGFSQERLAELADLSTNSIGHVERGEYDVTVATLSRISGALRHKTSDVLRAAGY